MKVKVAQSCPTLCDPMDCSPWNSPGQNTGVGGLSLLKGIFPTQGFNPGLLHCRQILYYLSHKGNPRIVEWVAYKAVSEHELVHCNVEQHTCRKLLKDWVIRWRIEQECHRQTSRGNNSETWDVSPLAKRRPSQELIDSESILSSVDAQQKPTEHVLNIQTRGIIVIKTHTDSHNTA